MCILSRPQQMAQSHINAGIHVAFAASSSTVLFVFEQEAYSEHVGISASAAVVDRVQLCAMANRPPGQYYRTEAEFVFPQ